MLRMFPANHFPFHQISHDIKYGGALHGFHPGGAPA